MICRTKIELLKTLKVESLKSTSIFDVKSAIQSPHRSGSENDCCHVMETNLQDGLSCFYMVYVVHAIENKLHKQQCKVSIHVK